MHTGNTRHTRLSARKRGRASIASVKGIVGRSDNFLEAMERFADLLRSRAPAVLLTGESGTGKSLCVRRIHGREAKPGEAFLSVQCAALPADLLEVEIFGSNRKRYVDDADGRPGLLDLVGNGTIFLDDVQECPPELDARLAPRLARGSGERLLSCRIVAASRTPALALALESPRNSFHDILQRNAVELPPLRKRGEDIELLAAHFIDRWTRKHGGPLPTLEEDALEALYDHHWPGNIRELRSTLERALDSTPARKIRREHLRIQTRQNHALGANSSQARDMILIPPEGKSWDRIEEEAVRATLELTGGNRSAAARILGISRPTLGRKIRKYRLRVPMSA